MTADLPWYFGATNRSCNATWRQWNGARLQTMRWRRGRSFARAKPYITPSDGVKGRVCRESGSVAHIIQSIKSKQKKKKRIGVHSLHGENGAWLWLKRKFIYLSFTQRPTYSHRGGFCESNKQTWPNFIRLTGEPRHWVIVEGVSGWSWVFLRHGVGY